MTRTKQVISYEVGGGRSTVRDLLDTNPPRYHRPARRGQAAVDDMFTSLTAAERHNWWQFRDSVARLTGQREDFEPFVRRILTLLRARMDAEPGKWEWYGDWTLIERVR